MQPHDFVPRCFSAITTLQRLNEYPKLFVLVETAGNLEQTRSGTISRMATVNLKLAVHLPHNSLLDVTTLFTPMCTVKKSVSKQALLTENENLNGTNYSHHYASRAF